MMTKCKTCLELAEWQNVFDSSKDYKSSRFVIKIKSNQRTEITTSQMFKSLRYCPNCATRLNKRYLRKLYKDMYAREDI